LRAHAIQDLLNSGALQLSLFDERDMAQPRHHRIVAGRRHGGDLHRARGQLHPEIDRRLLEAGWQEPADVAELRTFRGHTDTTSAIAITSDGSRVIPGGSDGTVGVWSFVTGDELLILRGHAGVVTNVTVSADGRSAVSASGFGDGTLRVWDLSTGGLLRTAAIPDM
jgi:WD40 repeat protein